MKIFESLVVGAWTVGAQRIGDRSGVQGTC